MYLLVDDLPKLRSGLGYASWSLPFGWRCLNQGNYSCHLVFDFGVSFIRKSVNEGWFSTSWFQASKCGNRTFAILSEIVA